MVFSVSVVIPVYNCQLYIAKAIDSVLQQPEVAEIVVVNDGSTDGTQAILQELQSQNSKLKVYYHKNNLNKGRSASRNLGIQKATGNYIAFLDADDYFLPNRFANDKVLFQENDKIDGVYNAIGAHFYREATLLEKESLELYTVNQKIKAEELFETLFSGKKGHFSIDGLTVKKSVFDAIGFFNESLMVAEDTDIIWKMALKCQLETGTIDRAVAIRGVHEENVFYREELYRKDIIKRYQSLVFWGCENQISFSKIDVLLKAIWIIKYKEKNKLHQDIGYWAKSFFPYPKLLFSILSIKYFPIIRLRKVFFSFLYRTKNK
ncbi:glycosyltransferase family 2 protein [Flavobacterium sp.]|uniref:glycosyltransferase family 2 protein n=1 Tax=Flavobacterium sp. TaxID=239 RepID=UPI00375287C7